MPKSKRSSSRQSRSNGNVPSSSARITSATARETSLALMPDDLEALYTPEMRNLCRTFDLPNTGGRRALMTRLLNEKQRLRSSTEDATTVEAVSSLVSNCGPVVSQAADEPSTLSVAFSNDQIAQITNIVQTSIQTFFQDHPRATESANPPTTDSNTQNTDPNAVPVNLPVIGETSQSTSLQRLEQLGQFPFLTSTELRQAIPTTTSTSHTPADGGFTPEIPAKYVRDIESGEFFELYKLLPKNLNKASHTNVGLDSNVSFTVSASGISLTPRKPQILTNIEDWTTAFNTYMLILVRKFPPRATELLQYMETIRHSAKTHGGLGWCIYDHKFRYKAANCRTMSWATIDTQLWLRIFTASPAQLRDDYSLFSNGPSTKSTGAARDGTCHNFNRGRFCPNMPNCPYAHRCNRIGCGGNHPGYQCQGNEDNPEPTENAKRSSKDYKHRK